MPVNMDDPKIKAKKEALRQLIKSDFYEPEIDNPQGEEHIPMEDELQDKPLPENDSFGLGKGLNEAEKKKKMLEDLMKSSRE